MTVCVISLTLEKHVCCIFLTNRQSTNFWN